MPHVPHVMTQRCTSHGGSLALVRYPAGLHLEPHVHAFTTVSMILRGGLYEDANGRRIKAGVLDLVVKPGGTRHGNLFFVEGTTLIQVAPSPETLRQAVDAGCPVERWTWTRGATAGRAMMCLARLVASGTKEDVAPAIADALAAVEGDEGRPAGPPPTWLRRVREALDEAARMGRAPHVGRLAEDAGVHRVHLSREFRRYYGVPPAEYRARARLREAAGHVGSTHQSLSSTAFRTGFADQAHMTREFQSRLGMTPRQYRRLLPPRVRPRAAGSESP